MTSKVQIFFTEITPSRNALIENIESYLQTLSPILTITNAQYIPPRLDCDIKINVNTAEAYMNQAIGNYMKVTTDSHIYYYFIIKGEWVAQKTLRLVLNMDTVNTVAPFIYSNATKNYSSNWLKTTNIVRETIKNTQYNSGQVLPIIDYESEGYAFNKQIKDDTLITTSNYDKNHQVAYMSTSKGLLPEVIVTSTASQTLSGFYYDLKHLADGQYLLIALNKTTTVNLSLNSNAQLKYREDGNTGVIDITDRKVQISQGTDKLIFIQCMREGDTIYFKFMGIEKSEFSHPSSISNVKNGDMGSILNSGGEYINIFLTGKGDCYFNSFGIADINGFLINNTPDYTYSTFQSHGAEDTYFFVGLKEGVANNYLYEYLGTTYDEAFTPIDNYYDAYSQLTSIPQELASYGLLKLVKEPYKPTKYPKPTNLLQVPDYCGYVVIGVGTLAMISNYISLRFCEILNPEGFSFNSSTTQGNTTESSITTVSTSESIFDADDLGNLEYDPKLLNSDYTCQAVVYDSDVLEIKNEEFSSYPSIFTLKMLYPNDLKDEPLIALINYSATRRYQLDNYPLMKTISKNNELPIFSNDYLDYLRLGRAYDAEQLRIKEEKGKRQETISAVSYMGGIVGGAMMGAKVGSVGGGYGAVAGAIIGSISAAVVGGITLNNQIKNIEESLAMEHNSLGNKQALLMNKNTNVSDVNNVELYNLYGKDKIHIMKYQVKDSVLSNLSRLFQLSGYNHPYIEKPNCCKLWWDYLKCTPSLKGISSPYANLMDDVKARFEQGVTIYHNVGNMWDFEQSHYNHDYDTFYSWLDAIITGTYSYSGTSFTYDLDNSFGAAINAILVKYEYIEDDETYEHTDTFITTNDTDTVTLTYAPNSILEVTVRYTYQDVTTTKDI